MSIMEKMTTVADRLVESVRCAVEVVSAFLFPRGVTLLQRMESAFVHRVDDEVW